jgi:hypothetical protein
VLSSEARSGPVEARRNAVRWQRPECVHAPARSARARESAAQHMGGGHR